MDMKAGSNTEEQATVLRTISASLNNNLIPVRMPYPAEEEALNRRNYNVASTATDNNSINFPVWWNK
jgi:hypothetical protein